MPKTYQLRPKVVQAIQFTGTNTAECLSFGRGAVLESNENPTAVFVHRFIRLKSGAKQLASATVAYHSDWIVKDSNGELRVLNNQQFNETYTDGANHT